MCPAASCIRVRGRSPIATTFAAATAIPTRARMVTPPAISIRVPSVCSISDSEAAATAIPLPSGRGTTSTRQRPSEPSKV